MTILNANLSPRHVAIVTDTHISHSNKGETRGFTSKVFPLPHLWAVLAGRGPAFFVVSAYARFNEVFLPDGIDDIGRRGPELLGELWEWFNAVCDDRGLPDDERQETEIFVAGLSRAQGRFVGYYFQSLLEFEAQPTPYGTGISPAVGLEQPPPILKLPKGLVEVAKRQWQIVRASAQSDAYGIGGELVFFFMDRAGMKLSKVHRFPDYDHCLTKARKGVAP